MRNFPHPWLLGLLLLFTGTAKANYGNLSLSPEQAQWVHDHPVVTVGVYNSDALPFEGFQDSKAVGYSYEYLHALTRSLGMRLEVRKFASLAEELQAACRGEVDVIMNLMITPERTACLAFSDPYLQIPGALVTRADNPQLIPANPTLTGLRIAVERGFYTRGVIGEIYPNATPLEADDSADALKMVASGKADVYLGNPYLVDALLQKYRIKGLALTQQNGLPLSKLHFAVPNAKVVLATALDAAMTAMPEQQLRSLQQRWLPAPAWTTGDQPTLSPEEARELAQPIRLGFVMNWAPISFLDAEGEPSGLVGDYMRRFRQAGANIELVPVKDLADLRDRIGNGSINAAIGVPRGMPTGDGWIYSKPFATVADVIVTRENARQMRDAHDLGGDRVAIAGISRLAPQVLAQAPEVKIMPARNVYQGLSMVDDGQADAYIGNFAVVDHLLREHYPGSLRIAAPANISDELVFVTHPQNAADVAVFNRMLTMMAPREHAVLRSAWLGSQKPGGIHWGALLRWLLPILLVLLTAAVVASIGYWRLRREVARRRLAQSRLAKVTSNLPAVVYQIRRTPDGQLSFPFIDGDLKSIFGVSNEEGIGDANFLLKLVHPDDQQALLQASDGRAARHGNSEVEFRARADNGWKWIRSCKRLHADDDGVMLWSGYWIDVTEARTKSEELIAAKAEAERAAAAKAEFLATMSHEIRTPMSGVLGMLEVLQHTGLDDEQHRVLETIEDSAQMLRQILDDILDLSKIEAGALTLESVPIELRQVIANVQQMLSAQAAEKQIRITNSIDERIAIMHMADGIRLRQVLFNLLSNAIKFTERGGVTIMLTLLDDEPGYQSLQLSVIDTGIGISEDQKERLFKPFSQAEISTQRQYGGTGLGLSICRRLIDLMGGSIELCSSLGKGSRFDINLALPVCVDHERTKLAENTVEHRPLAKLDWSLLRVLVAEDHPTNQTLMRWRMNQLGVPCDMVADGEAALTALRDTHYDLLITDCHMPHKDGYELASEWRAEETQSSLPRLPIIAMTASAVSGESELCRKSGMDDFLVKPVSLVELQEAMARWLSPIDASQASMVEAEPVAEPTSDSAHANLLKRFGTQAVVDEIVRTLVPAMHDDLAQLQQAVLNGSVIDVTERLHRMTGAIGSVGEHDLAQHARDTMYTVEAEGLASAQDVIEVFVLQAQAYVRQLEPR